MTIKFIVQQVWFKKKTGVRFQIPPSNDLKEAPVALRREPEQLF